MKIIDDFISFVTKVPTSSQLLILGSFLVLVFAHFQFVRSKKFLLPALLISAFFMATAFALIDPYLHMWDEAFHALVGKNTSHGYLSPNLLIDPSLGYDPHSWVYNYIWLHKPPMAIWQIALSIDLLGQNLIAVRLPSIFAFVATTYFVFKIAYRLFNRTTAYYSGVLFILFQFSLEQVAGVHTSEHIDVSFTLYITASFWAWIVYQQENKAKYLLLIGIFAGLAVLTKWLVGLLIFGAWGGYLITLITERNLFLRQFFQMIKAFGVTLLVILPWNIFAATYFPKEYWYEFNHARRHFSEPIEGHGGDYYYYWDNLSTLFGSGTLTAILVVVSIVFAIVLIKKRRDRIVLGIMILLPYLFFTVASTKMSNFVNIVSPLILICVAAVFVWTINVINKRLQLNQAWSFILIPFLFISLIRPAESYSNHHFDEQWKRDFYSSRYEFISNIKSNPKTVFFYYEMDHYEYISHMFLHESLALNGLPSREQLEIIEKKGMNITVVYPNERPSEDLLPKKTEYIKTH